MPNSPVPPLLIVLWEERVLCDEFSSTSSILSMTTSHCSLGLGLALIHEAVFDSSADSSSVGTSSVEVESEVCMGWIGIGPLGSLRAAMLKGESLGKDWACSLRRWMSSTFFPFALIECILHSLTS